MNGCLVCRCGHDEKAHDLASTALDDFEEQCLEPGCECLDFTVGRWITREEAIDAVREIGRPLGYAVAVHGSLARDVDLIAVPWVDDAAGPDALVAAICSGLPGGGHLNGPPEDKPHFRRAWSIIALGRDPHDERGWYLDLSVLPTFAVLRDAA